jgi:hypothetical protein
MDKTIKMLLLKLNRQGKEASLIRINKYSKEFGSISAYYKLTFWKKIIVPTEDGEEKERNVPETHEFSKAMDLIRYMVVRSNE